MYNRTGQDTGQKHWNLCSRDSEPWKADSKWILLANPVLDPFSLVAAVQLRFVYPYLLTSLDNELAFLCLSGLSSKEHDTYPMGL